MNTGRIEIIYGDGGKTAMALGKGLVAAANQKDVVVIRFLKGGADARGDGGSQAPGTGDERVLL